MALSLLQIIQEARARLGQTIPSSAAGNTDAGVRQCVALLNEFLEDLVLRRFWQANIREATWTATAAEDQGALETLFPYGYEGLIADTFFNRTTSLPVRGGLSAEEWANRKATNVSGPLPAFRIRGNHLLANPLPTAGDVFAVEYYSSYFVYNSLTTTYRKYWLSDDDICTVDDALAVAYLKWAWKRDKGLDYAEDFRKYEAMLESRSLRDNRAQPLSMEGGEVAIGPGIVVAPGSWSL